MLTVYRSNRADLLAQLLGQHLRLVPPDPFETVSVVVNTWPTSRWLGEQLALELGGIAANIRFPFPGSQLRAIVEQLLGESAEGPEVSGDPWRAGDLVWPVLELLPQLVEAPEAAPLRRWLEQRNNSGELDETLWQLARAIADGLDDLSLYRPALAAAWWQGGCGDSRGHPLPESLAWQPLLVQRLRERLGRKPFGLRTLDLIERLRQGQISAEGIPSPLRLFGLSSAPPVQVQLLQALALVLPVDMYLLTPCADLWQRCVERRRELQDALALEQPFGLDWLLQTPGLEARFGRLGGEFQQLLEGTGESQLGSSQELDLFLLPATAAAVSGRRPSLLEQLQEHLAQPSDAAPLQRSINDHSLEFHPCPGGLRQVQIVRDRLLQLLAADPSLEPRHILVMTPQVDQLAPLLASVFSDSEATGVELPWRLTDRSQLDDAGIAQSLLQLLRLAGERLTASGLEGLLEGAALQEHHQLEPREAAAITRALQACGFRWGLDGAERGGGGERAGAEQHSLSWAIDRLLLGLVLPNEPGLAIGDCAPHPLAGTPESQGRWILLLSRLRRAITELRRSRRAEEWGPCLRALLEELFGDGGERAWELATIHQAIAEWTTGAAGCQLTIPATVVAAVLQERLSADSGRFGHRSGALTISALEPMRAIPYRVIVLMGLDAEVFPRRRQRPSFHPMEHQRLLGDPNPADQDRYVLLEALLSARDHLLISWSSRDERRGDPLPPPAPVRQWLDQLRAELGAEGFEGLVVDHAVNPLDRRNFLPSGLRPPSSCDQRLRQARQRLEDPSMAAQPLQPLALRQSPEPAAAPGGSTGPRPDPGVDAFEDLRRWLMAPQESWLQQLGLRPREWADPVEDLEALSLDELRRSRLLRDQLASGSDDPAPPNWLRLWRGRGLAPPLTAGELEGEALSQRWSSLQLLLEQLGEASRRRHQWQDLQERPNQPLGVSLEAELEWRQDQLVLVHTARARPPHQLDLWLRLLLACASGQAPRQAVLIARDQDRFVVVQRLQALEAQAAAELLEQLLSWRHSHHQCCWPVPPETGWAYARAEHSRPGSGSAKALQCWEGTPPWSEGERQQDAMALCFGRDCPADSLLQGEFGPFESLAMALHEPLLKQQLKP
ncbi:exodeoxyribonuclease V subunit gamma [Synechococcus sp. CS-1329]|uniref:exodeoxyribonuclease V subunit gamma n=1 Tax=Synechococcus sp. CS-1329 TaxID=2847975 RepID=UPI00223ABB35|nr:exodeoxyribonuclease V subunit gamma [Synechococcus sp. CS-1329]MCT0219561.1 exodeoxyribonuclease V subunit gamma [Synechococcus sp. CS-1329]